MGQLKGKKIVVNTDYEKANYGTYPKMILKNTQLTLLDKLILITCHSYPTKDRNGKPQQWILAYTRMSVEIGCDKSHLIRRWKHLIDCGYIVESQDEYIINYEAIINNRKIPPIPDKRKVVGPKSPSPDLQLQDESQGRVTPSQGDFKSRGTLVEDSLLTPPMEGSVTPPELVVLKDTHGSVTPPFFGSVTQPNEYKIEKQEEDDERKTTIEKQQDSEDKEQNSGLSSGSSPNRLLTSVDISNQLNDYLNSESKFFFGDNRSIVANSYLDFYKEYPDAIVKINGYEQLLYVQLQSSLSTLTKIIENPKDLNEVLSNTPRLTIPACSVFDFMGNINQNKRGVAEIFKKIIADVEA